MDRTSTAAKLHAKAADRARPAPRPGPSATKRGSPTTRHTRRPWTAPGAEPCHRGDARSSTCSARPCSNPKPGTARNTNRARTAAVKPSTSWKQAHNASDVRGGHTP
jgi:hypothetical protein